MAANDFSADRQAHSTTGVFVARLQAPENSKHLFQVLLIDADPVVAHRKGPLRSTLFRGDMDFGNLGAAVLDGVYQYVLEEPGDLNRIAHDARQGFTRDDGACLLHQGTQVENGIVESRGTV